jgi:hypothetical protein
MPGLLKKFERQYEQMVEQACKPAEISKLNWVQHANGTQIPDITNSFWELHFRGEIAPIEVIKKNGLPGLFIWGGKDRQVNVRRQSALVEQAVESGATIETIRFSDRHHLLSLNEDLDWFEPGFAQTLAKQVRKFLNKVQRAEE